MLLHTRLLCLFENDRPSWIVFLETGVSEVGYWHELATEPKPSFEDLQTGLTGNSVMWGCGN